MPPDFQGFRSPSMLEFVKMQGLGNDFIVVDEVRHAPWGIDSDAARRLCDRHFGIGADGVLVVGKPGSGSKTGADFSMLIWNADGTMAEMCGNGLRCVVKWAVDEGVVAGPRVRVSTGNGVLTCDAARGADGKIATVAVQMGAPILEAVGIPVAGVAGSADGRVIAGEIVTEAGPVRFTGVSMGNPHAVVFGDATLEAATRLGVALQKSAHFPRSVNVELVSVRSRAELDVVVYERGCGITLACGTGACAAVVAAALEDRVDWDRDVVVNLAGGRLTIRAPRDLGPVVMTGPAVEAFRGTAS